MVYVQHGIRPSERDTQDSLEFWDKNLISTRQPLVVIVNKKQRTCRNVDFAVPADHNEKLKEGDKRDKYLDLA